MQSSDVIDIFHESRDAALWISCHCQTRHLSVCFRQPINFIICIFKSSRRCQIRHFVRTFICRLSNPSQYQHGSTLMSAWISNHMPSKMWDAITIPKLQQCNRWSLRMDKWLHPELYTGCNYLSMQGLKLNHVSKRGSAYIRSSRGNHQAW